MPKLINSACSWLLIAVYKQIITKFLVIQVEKSTTGKTYPAKLCPNIKPN